MTALAMQIELKRLALRHDAAEPKPCFVPLAAPVDYVIEITGLASTTDIDLSRQRFRAYAFNNPCLLLSGYPLPKLLYKHDESQIAGTIQSLGYDDRGNLRICAEVTHDLAKRCNAFSIGARILEYSLVDTDTENFHALSHQLKSPRSR